MARSNVAPACRPSTIRQTVLLGPAALDSSGTPWRWSQRRIPLLQAPLPKIGIDATTFCRSTSLRTTHACRYMKLPQPPDLVDKARCSSEHGPEHAKESYRQRALG